MATAIPQSFLKLKQNLEITDLQASTVSTRQNSVREVMEAWIVDVVPGFRREGGGFLIPNSANQSWISTDPKKHVAMMTAANKTHSGSLVPLIKIIKAWNKNNNKYFSSFHLAVKAEDYAARGNVRDAVDMWIKNIKKVFL